MSDIVLEAQHVHKKFKKGELYDTLRDFIPAFTGRMLRHDDDTLEEREFWALKDVSFQVSRGEAFGIIGSNGAGKSTMLKLLSGIMKPTKGKIKVEGSLSALIEVGAGFHPDLTGRENIYLNGTILGMTRNEINEKFDEIVNFSGLEEFIDTPVKRYSSGMYARLGFSVAAHVDPDILIIDEVLSVGDYLFQKKCLDKMTSVIRSGATVIFVSHNLRAVSDLCSDSILLDHGEVVKTGATSEVIQTYMMRNSDTSLSDTNKQVYVSNVTIRDERAEKIQFKSGEKAWLDVEVTANSDMEKLAIVLDVKDESYYNIFDTSTQRLGHDTFSLKKGEKFTCTFEIDINLAYGTFYFATTIYRYDIQKAYDTRFPAATIYVSTDQDVRGAVNLRPKVLNHTIVKKNVDQVSVEQTA